MRKLVFPAQRVVSSLLAHSHRRFLSVAAPEPVISVYIDMKSPHSYLALQVAIHETLARNVMIASVAKSV
jgi:hypothetical protein